MKIRKIQIKNYRSLHDITIDPTDILALVGRNNSGKSNVLKALELFFTNSNKLINDDCFYYHDNQKFIKILITFEGFNEWEQERVDPYLINGKLILGKEIICREDGSFGSNSILVNMVPEPEWLQESLISLANINQWWNRRVTLVVNGLNFGMQFVSSKSPSVASWKDTAKNFVEEHRNEIPFIEKEILQKNMPQKLNEALPEFIYIPAVRDISDETKVLKTNPFGLLINSIIEKISDSEMESISRKISQIEKKLNRDGNNNRIREFKSMESRLNTFMEELMDCDIEIRMSVPKLRDIFINAKIYANDGITTPIEAKGQGLQRAMIFTILRAYADFMDIQTAGENAKNRCTIFAIEEPEIYLHPQFQRTLMSVFRSIASGNDQIFYTTQSNLFVDIMYFDQVCIMRREKRDEKYGSYPTQLLMSSLIEDLKVRKGISSTPESMRELYSNAFNPMVNEGFFADKVVIVEGPSEQYSLPIYADIMGYNFDRDNISIVHSNGKGQMDRIMRVFNGFKIPVYICFDGDKDTKDASNRETTLELLNLLGSPIHSVEQIRTEVADAYTIFEYDYDIIISKKIKNYDLMIKDAKKNLGHCGKPLGHRFVANKLKKEANGDSRKVPKIIREIIENIRNVSYSGCMLKKLN
jgi:putative ATP-dependent endonuclease of OLD family